MSWGTKEINEAAQTIEKLLSEFKGKFSVPFRGENDPHPMGLLKELISLKQSALMQEKTQVLTNATLEALLETLVETDATVLQVFREKLLTRLESHVQTLERLKVEQESKKSNIIVPGKVL